MKWVGRVVDEDSVVVVVHIGSWRPVICLFFPFSRMRKEEVQSLSGPNEFSEFYTRLKQLREFHKRHPNEVWKFFIYIKKKLSDILANSISFRHLN